MKFDVKAWVENHAQELTETNNKIWAFAETGLQESKSAQLLADILSKAGFSVDLGVADMPTALVASYGSGNPVIAILAEYDALSGISQKALPVKEPLEEGKGGHGCGHNMLGTGSLGACLAVKEAIDAGTVTGTIRFYGCPAEEIFNAKGQMAKAHLFDDVDLAITWHPATLTGVQLASSLAVNSAVFNFHGVTAHAAGDPFNGRSALDAVELMNVGVNYLREHITPDARIHYTITNGGGEPNVVPAEAASWYYVRAPKRKTVEEIYAKVIKIAEGACLMTETSLDVEFIDGTYNLLPNETIGNVLHEKLMEVGAPQFDCEDKAFAEAISKTYPESYIASHLDKIPDSLAEYKDNLTGKYLCDTILPPYGKGQIQMGSTDVADISWVVPTAQFRMATHAIGTPGHSWQLAASAGMSIGHKGMLQAAKALGLTAIDFMQSPEKVAEAKAEFIKSTAGETYTCPLPDGLMPPINRFGNK